MKIIYLSFCLLAAFSFNATNARAQGSLILNGSFENGGGSFTNWNVHSLNGIVEVGLEGLGTLDAMPPDGTHYAAFLYYGGTISQTITTMPGYYYALSFSAIQFQGTNNVSINVNGSLLATLNFSMTLPITYSGYGPYVTNWDSFNYIFQASSNLTTLAFTYYPQIITDNDNDTYYGSGGLDAISVMAVPEPKTVILLIGSFVGWLVCGRRHKQLKQDKK